MTEQPTPTPSPIPDPAVEPDPAPPPDASARESVPATTGDATSILFGPPDHDGWTRIRFALAWKQRLSMMIARLIVSAGLIAAMVIFPSAKPILLGILGALVLLTAFEWWLKGRWVRNFGYAEREDDLWVTSGAMLRRMTVVPFGRMQLVDVAQGPLDRLFGLAHVQLHTASASTDARIPGLSPDEAARLRDRLTELGTAELSGL